MESLRSYDRWRMNTALFRRWLFANHRTGGWHRTQPVFSLGNKKPRLVSIHAESTGVTGVIEVRPVLEGSGRDADPCQRQLLGPSVLAKMIATQRTGGGQQHASGPLFIELFSRCSFHLPARPTSPLNLRCRQVLVSERFSLMFLGTKPDGASRSRIHIDLQIWINPVLQGDPLEVVLVTDAN